MSKKYRLLKDLPKTKAGAIVEPNAYGVPVHSGQIGNGWPFFYSEGGLMLNEFIPASYVTNEEWFEEVKEPERIGVRILPNENYAEGKWFGWYVLETTKAIPNDKLPAIKKAIEEVLNHEAVEENKDFEFVIGVDPIRGNFEWKDDAQTQVIFKKHEKGEWIAMYRKDEPWSQERFESDMKKAAEYFSSVPLLCEECGEIGKHKPTCPTNSLIEENKEVSKDWEILSAIDEWNVVHGPFDSPIVYIPHGAKIHSVRRLSDNTIWAVGEETTADTGYEYKPIKRFFEKEGVMYAQFDEGYGSNDGCLGLNSLKKLPPKPQPLFVTEDGKEIFPDDPYWHIVSDWSPQIENATEAGRQQYKTRTMQTYSTKEAADEYILNNKPCLSINDCCKVYDTFYSNGTKSFRQECTDVAKSKQSI